MSSISAAVPVDPFAVAISYCEHEIQAWQAVVATTTMTTMTPPNVNDTSGGSSNNNNNKDEMIELLQQMVTYIQQKLWHQLTITLLQFLLLSLLLPARSVVDSVTTLPVVGNVELFYRNVIQTVQNKLHPLAVARMTVLIASSLLRRQQQQNQSPAAAQAMMEQCATTLQEQLAASSSSSAAGSANPSSRRTAGGSGSSSTGGMIRSTPQSYTEAILYVQCQQALVTFYEYGTMQPPKSPPEMKVALRAIYQKVIQPNASVIQDLLAMATSAAESNNAPMTTATATAANSHADVTAQYASTMVHAAYYEMTMHYYKFIAPYTNTFYEHAMQYLQYSNLSTAAVATAATTTMSSTTTTTNLQLAIDICWAAILGEGIYNLSVVIEHPFIVQQFNTIPAESNIAAIGGQVVPVSQQYQQWLWSLINALAMSDYHACTQLLTTLSSSSSTEIPPGFPNIPNVIPMIREKLTLIQLLQLITLVKNTNERSFAFADLQTALHITDCNDIEIILMRALSIGLIRGTIDQCEQLVHITYIQPQRVLTTTQMQHLLQQYQFWSHKVQTNVQQVQEQTNLMTTTTNNNNNNNNIAV
jgi:PCI domain